MSEDEVQLAEQLIEARHYLAARQLLDPQRDNPTARRYLRQINRCERLEQEALAVVEAIEFGAAAQEDTQGSNPGATGDDGWPRAFLVIAVVYVIVMVIIISNALRSDTVTTPTGLEGSAFNCRLMYSEDDPERQRCIDNGG